MKLFYIMVEDSAIDCKPSCDEDVTGIVWLDSDELINSHSKINDAKSRIAMLTVFVAISKENNEKLAKLMSEAIDD